MRVVINVCFGGFGLSRAACEHMGVSWDGYGHAGEIERHDPRLIAAVEALGDEANGTFAKLRIVEIPDGVAYEIEEYDGKEHIAEAHRTWS